MSSSVVVWLLGHAGVLALVLARVLGLSWTAPALATPGLGGRFRLVLAAVLSALVLPVIGPSVAVAPVPAAAAAAGWAALGRVCVVEGLIGAALGFSAALIVAGARQAGEVVGLQAGLAPAALFDPEAGDDLTPLGHLYGLVALAVFLALDGPLVLVAALVESYRVLPAGTLIQTLSEETARQAFGRLGAALELVVRAAAPTALALALAGIALGLLGRAAPSLPLVAMSLPARFLLGLVLVVVGLAALTATMATAWGNWPGF
jgi:flagellar biosynthesis protein FliR